jgi:hypothetical protein
LTDTVTISGDVAIRKAPEAPTIDVELPPPPPPDPETLPEARLSDWPEGSREREDLAVRESVKALQKQREERGNSPWVTDDGYDQTAPIAKWDASSLPEAGEHESTHRQVRRASDALRSARMAAKAAAFETLPSMTPQESREAAEVFDKIETVKVPTVSDRGEPVPLLDDHQPIDAALDGFKNLAEAARAMKNYRALAQQQEQSLMAELQAREDQQNAELQKALAAPVAPEPSATQPALQPQPDTLAQEKAQLADAQRRLAAQAHWNQISNAERAAATEISEIRNWLPAAFSQDEMRNPQLIADAERRGWLHTAVERHNALLGEMAKGQQLRNAAIMQASQQQAAQAARFSEHSDNQFQAWLEREHPAYSKGRARQELMEVAKEVVSPAIAESYRRGGEARSLEGQKLIAESAMWRLAQKRARDLTSHRARPLPPVTPGAYRPSGANAEADIAALERQIANAPSAQKQLQLARRLTQARRAAGLLDQQG